MRTKLFLGSVMIVASLLSVGAIRAVACGKTARMDMMAKQVTSDDEQFREQSIQELRKAGPKGLQAVVDTYKDLIDQHSAHPLLNLYGDLALPPRATGNQLPEEARRNLELAATKWRRVKEALDAVGGQKDNQNTQLFWHTDLDQAKAASAKSGKPILSLRLLGKLTDELSCANSRFFRTTLYPHAEINKVLRDNFILHWQTFRNVPIVTIDFGEGRKIVRTLTGNSIHYVLAADGRPIEAIPGLYGPAAFLRQLQSAEKLHHDFAAADKSSQNQLLAKYHVEQVHHIFADWTKDLDAIRTAGGPVPAIETDPRHHLYVKQQLQNKLASAMTDDLWQRIAGQHAADAQLDAAGVAAVTKKMPPNARVAGLLAVTKARVELPWERMVRNLQGAIALDAIKNEYTFHRQIHEWFASGWGPTADVFQLNEQVYSQLFLMPSNDPWLGLSLPDQYSGIAGGGLVEDRPAVAAKK